MNLTRHDRASVVRRRAPAVPIVLAFAAGIFANEMIQPSESVGLAVSTIALLASVLATFLGCFRLSVLCLLVAVASAGALRHGEAWFTRNSNEIGAFATKEPRPARLIGRIVERPQLVREKQTESSRPWDLQGRSLLVVQCRQLRDGDQWQDLVGKVRVAVPGLASELRIGDEVELLGRLSLVEGPRNVGEFDFAAFLRRQGIEALLQCRSLDAIRLLRRPDDFITSIQRQLVRARERSEQLLRDTLQADAAPVALALLLGSRTRMSSQQYEAFVESGTMHVLAISGLNVAILALFVSGICRLINLPRVMTAVSILVLVGAYAAITDAGPPVVRASLLVFLASLGWPWDRPTHANNLLAVTGLGVLIWNPLDAFNTGAQLSFLAVAVIVWHSIRRGVQREEARIHAEMSAATRPPRTAEELAKDLHDKLPRTILFRKCNSAWIALCETTSVSTFIWLFTSVLIARQFHLISPVGLLANIPLLPTATLTLCLGYGLLLLGFVSQSLARLIAVPFEWGLKLMLWIVDFAADFSCGHRYIPTPPTWWLVGAGLCLTSLFCGIRIPLRRHPGWMALSAWAMVGLVVPLWPKAEAPLRVSVLSVGHGLSVLIEAPSGGTLLYDAGTMGNVRRAKDVVQQALWHSGHNKLDGIVLSHADSDHVNAVPGLIRTTPIGRIFVSPQFLDWSQPAVSDVLHSAGHCQVPVRLTWIDDGLPFDKRIDCRVLHPIADDKLQPDNANSIVLSIEFAGRRILLTGDLEREGLSRLMQSESRRVDVLLSPHHGSLGANTTELARWAKPTWLVVSADRRANLAMLRSRFGPETTVLSTAQAGAITFEIWPDGRLQCATFRNDPSVSPRLAGVRDGVVAIRR